MNLQEFVTIALSSSAISGIIGGLLSYYQNRRKVLAEANSIENQSLRASLEFQSKQLHELQADNELLRKENQEIRKQLEALRAEFEAQKHLAKRKEELEGKVKTLTKRVEELEGTLTVVAIMFVEYVEKYDKSNSDAVKGQIIKTIKNAGITI